MRILLSAYACEPNRGSESGVGWHWAVELARAGHDVWVLTRTNNRRAIERELHQHPVLNLHFTYYDLPVWARLWKKKNRGVHLYYLLWQWGAYKSAKRLANEVAIELVHHVTFVSVRQPSFMGLLGMPFVFGPVAGGDTTPTLLRKTYPRSGRLRETIRDVANWCVRVDPFMHLTFSKAQSIVVTSRETLKVVPSPYRSKTEIELAIGSQADISQFKRSHSSSAFRILYVGQLLYLKGIHLGLAAIAQLRSRIPTATFTIVGSGSDEEWLRKHAQMLGIETAVRWVPWMSRDHLQDEYLSHDVLLFPSLHDSGGMVVLEAMSHSLPVVCLDLGGPGVLVSNDCGRVIPTAGMEPRQVEGELAHALLELSDPKTREMLGKNASRRAQQFRWDLHVARVYSKLGITSPRTGVTSERG